MKPQLRFKEFTDDWEEKKLGEISTSKGGTALEKYVNDNGKYYFISIGNYGTNGKYIDNGQRIDLNDKTKEKLLEKNNLVMILNDKTSSGEILGTCILISENDKYIYNQRSQRIILNSDIYPLYAYYYLNYPFRKKIVRQAQGGTQIYVNYSNVENTTLKVPSLLEQEKIGKFLSLLDQRIEKQERKVELLEKEKKGWMQKLFQQEIRFKDEQGNNYPEWEEHSIQEVYKITRGKVLSKNKVLENGLYPVYSSQTLHHGLLGYFDKYLFENAITWTTDGANAGTVNFRKGKFYCTNVCGVLLNEEGYANQCMAEILNSIAYRYVSRVGNPKLMNNVMADIFIKFPSLDEQEKIANFLSLLDERIEKEQEKLRLMREEKKGYMERMFV